MAMKGSNPEQESDIALKQASTVESSRPPASFETPRASSASSVPSSVSVRSTPTARNREKPTKYVSQMAKAREEKKRIVPSESSSNSDKSALSDMETSSNPSSATSISDMSKEKLSNLPKFGEWEKHSANSGPCYTLLFQNAAQEKKVGGIIRVHAPLPSVPNEDLYGHNRAASEMKPPGRKKKSYGLLCCFTSSESS